MKLFHKLFFVLIVFFLFSSNVLADSVGTMDCNTPVMYGSVGSNVLFLQKKLNKVMKCNLDTDGSFGYYTQACVRSFQSKYNLTADGSVGKATCKKLNKVAKDKTKYTVITSDTLNVRRKATTNSGILTTVTSGNNYKIYKTINNNEGTWYKIKVNKKYGYIYANYTSKTAIVVSITKQKLYYFKNGKIVLDANVVTGKRYYHDTPVGTYVLSSYNKVKGTTLRGYNDDGSRYASYVDYWMPFIMSRGIGFHDASWRGNYEFNTETYKYSGSHGCVNMRHDDAKSLYNNINGNITVIVKK